MGVNVGVQIFLGILLANFHEWWIHKYLLHKLGKNKSSIWNFHWHSHHKLCRKYEGLDPTFFNHYYIREVLGLFGLFLIHVPLLLWDLPILLSVLALYGLTYYFVHVYAHLNPEWCKKNLRWHWDHHMGKDQDANWCIVFPLMDYLFGTRKKD